MITYYYQPLPEIPGGLITYCNYHHYPLSLKKKYIIAQLICLSTDTDIDELMIKIGFYCNSISKSSVYLVMQWMIAQGLIKKTITGSQLKVVYKTNFNRLSAISLYYAAPNHLTAPQNLTVTDNVL